MNQHIRELMVEAGYAAPELAGRAQVLAHLVVSRCVDKIQEMHGWHTLNNQEYPDLWHEGVASAACFIEDHFGESHENEH